MADAPDNGALAPVTEEAFLADRKAFWSFFTGATKYAVIAVVVILLVLLVTLVF